MGRSLNVTSFSLSMGDDSLLEQGPFHIDPDGYVLPGAPFQERV